MAENVETLRLIRKELLAKCRSKGADCDICARQCVALDAAIAALQPSSEGAEVEALRAIIAQWVEENGPGGWIDGMRQQLARVKALAQELDLQADKCEAEATRLEAGGVPVAMEMHRDAAQYRQTAYQILAATTEKGQ